MPPPAETLTVDGQRTNSPGARYAQRARSRAACREVTGAFRAALPHL